MTELTDVLKREHEAAEKCHKELNNPGDRKVRVKCYYTSLLQRAVDNNCNLKHQIPDHMSIAFHKLSVYDAHLFIKKLRKKLNRVDIGIIAENKDKYISFSIRLMSSSQR